MNNKNFLKCFVDDIFDKIFKTEIFIYDVIVLNIRQNNKLLVQLNNTDKELVIKSLEQTSKYNIDFSYLLIEYL